MCRRWTERRSWKGLASSSALKTFLLVSSISLGMNKAQEAISSSCMIRGRLAMSSPFSPHMITNSWQISASPDSEIELFIRWILCDPKHSSPSHLLQTIGMDLSVFSDYRTILSSLISAISCYNSRREDQLSLFALLKIMSVHSLLQDLGKR